MLKVDNKSKEVIAINLVYRFINFLQFHAANDSFEAPFLITKGGVTRIAVERSRSARPRRTLAFIQTVIRGLRCIRC
jgi:hypothetical protein